ncbi:MAG: hypothetical protein QXL17_03460 [Candidatus Thermoplasmatota archaeon]
MEQKNRENKKYHQVGLLGVAVGILSIIFMWIPLMTIIAIVFAILAVVLGYIAKKHGDRYGFYGFILGIIAIVLVVILTLLAATLYVYVSGFVGGQ